MTLEERIENVLLKYEIAREESKVKMIESITEDFAIEFAEWVCKCEYNIQWFKDQNKTNELLEMYKETL